MAELLQMWAFVEVLGFVCLPLTVTVFHNLPDRGWAFSKVIGIAVLAFCVWLPLMLFHVLFFNQFLVFGIFLILLAFNIVGFLDLVYANISTFKDHVDPVQLGTSYYLAAVNVPAMVVVHILIFAYLLSPRSTVSVQSSKLATGQRRDR